MRSAWFLALAVFLPLTVSAHPGPLDQNSCHYCKVNCDMYGLKTGDYVCHIGTDRNVNFTYEQLQRIRRELQLSQRPTLREVAIALRKRLAKEKVITTAKDKACWPTVDALSGVQKAPMLPAYKVLGRLGELLTAFSCKNSLLTVPLADSDGNIAGPLTLHLKRSPTLSTQQRLKSLTFECHNPDDAIKCTDWILDLPLIPAVALKPLLNLAGEISSMDCPSCIEPEQQASVPAPSPAASLLEELVPRTDQGASSQESASSASNESSPSAAQ